jgi:hypothetical protein
MSRTFRLTAFAGALAAAMSLAGSAFAQAYDGDWAGVLEAGGQKLHLELTVKTAGKDTNAVLNSVDQGSVIPASAVKVENGELGILFLPIGGELKGKLSADGNQIVGSWTQGMTLPLTLTKRTGK